MTTSIIDNLAENTLLAGLKRLGDGGQELSIATAFFSLNALLLLADVLAPYERIVFSSVMMPMPSSAGSYWKCCGRNRMRNC